MALSAGVDTQEYRLGVFCRPPSASGSFQRHLLLLLPVRTRNVLRATNVHISSRAVSEMRNRRTEIYGEFEIVRETKSARQYIYSRVG